MSNTFEIKIWDPNNDEIVSQFLNVLCLAFNNKDIYTKESFLWTHRDNPAGSSIISYALDTKTDSVVAICPFWVCKMRMQDEEYFGTQAIDAVTHPDYQKLGLLKKLTSYSLDQSSESNAALFFTFPNHLSSSYRGFVKIGIKDQGSFYYLFKSVRNQLKIPYLLLMKRNELKFFYQTSKLQPESINLQIISDQLNHFINQRRKWPDVWSCDRSMEFYKWRFVDNPKHKYEVIRDDDFIAFIRRGYRSDLYEIKLSDLLFNINDKNNKHLIKKIIKIIKTEYSPDILSICLTKNHPYFKFFKNSRFVPAPFRTRHLSIDLPICPEHLRSKKMALSNIDVDVE